MELPPQPLTRAQRERTVELWFENIRAFERRQNVTLGSERTIRRAVEAGLDFPPYLPLVSELLGGCGRLVLVRALETGAQEWVEIDPLTSAPRARVIVPAGWEPVGLGCEGVLAMIRDEFELPALLQMDWR